MWRKYFDIVKIVPGRVVTQQFGVIDFSSDRVPVETCKTLFEEDFPYLQITEAGKSELYGIQPAKTTAAVKQKKARRSNKK